MPREIVLWRAVVRTLLNDATRDLAHLPPSRERHVALSIQDEARTWLGNGGPDFTEVCGLAAIDPARLTRVVGNLQAANWQANSCLGASSTSPDQSAADQTRDLDRKRKFG
jgi:hypothetical protein